ncbi:unnamed protein product [Auanema sp. JU1783]|nr:unnamed protein product [Auanema sp. JU1783]
MVVLEIVLCLLVIIIPIITLCTKKAARIRKKSFSKRKGRNQENICTTPTPKMTETKKTESTPKEKMKQKDEKTPLTVESAAGPTSQTGQKPELVSSSPKKDENLSDETQNNLVQGTSRNQFE